MNLNIDAKQEKNIRALFYLMAGLGGLVALMSYMNEKKTREMRNQNEELALEIKRIQLKLLKEKEKNGTT
jgi:lipid-A-disaccharide synthase-like uncharacterized protein